MTQEVRFAYAVSAVLNAPPDAIARIFQRRMMKAACSVAYTYQQIWPHSLNMLICACYGTGCFHQPTLEDPSNGNFCRR